MSRSSSTYKVAPYHLNFSSPLKTGAGTISGRDGLMLRLNMHGVSGVGTSPALKRESIRASVAALTHWVKQKLPTLSPERLLYESRENLPHYELSTLVEIAARDAFSKIQRRPFGLSFIGARESAKHLPVMGLLNPSQPIEEELERAFQNGYRALKLKVGSPDMEDLGIEEDLNNIKKIRERVGDMRLVLDANGAYPLEQAESILGEFAKFDIAYIEEPVSGIQNLSKLALRSPIPVAVDESCRSLDALEQVAAVPEIQVIVIKPTLFHDLQRLYDKAAALQRNGKSIVISSAIDGAVGLAVAAHFASILNEAEDTFTGLDTSRLILKDLATPYPILNGTMIIPDEIGLGLNPFI